jgi:heptosyltransferase-1
MKKILLIKPSGIGDIVHSLPVAIGLKYLYPDAELHWLVFSKFANILETVDYVDKIIHWDRNGGLKEYFRIIKMLKKENYDLVIDLQVLFRTAFLGFLVYRKRIYSTSYIRELTNFFVKPVAKFNKNLHAVERNYQVVEFFAKKEKKAVPHPLEMLPWIKISVSQQEEVKKFLNYDEKKKYVVCSVSSRGGHKIWPAENFVKLISMLAKQFNNLIFVLVGSKNEVDKANIVIKNLKDVDYINLVGLTTLKELCLIISLATLTISNDNGIAHISAALDKPTLILFGPSNPKWFYPYNKKSGYIYKPIKCSPCGIKTLCKDNKCMKQILPSEVFNYILEKFGGILK